MYNDFDALTFIMAGGKGKRLYPLTKDRTKPAVPFGGIYRIIDFTLSNCLNSGFHRIHVLTQYRSSSLLFHIRKGWNIFDPQVGSYIDVVPAQQRINDSWYRGTADAIYQNLFLLRDERPQYCMILAGDHIYKMNYQNLAKFYVEKGADFVLGVTRMPAEKSEEFGVCELDADGRLINFSEKPSKPQTIPDDPHRIHASMGIYFTSAKLIDEILTEEAKKENGYDFGKDIIPAIFKKFKVYAYDFNRYEKYGSYWRDVGKIDDYYNANMDLVKIIPEFNLYDRDWPIRTTYEQFPPAKTVYDGSFNPSRKGESIQSLLSHGAVISGGKVIRSVISPGVRINSFSLVEDSILLNGVDIGRYAKIKRAIVDKGVQIPQHAEIGYNLLEDKKRFHVTENGIVVIAKGENIPSLKPSEY
ncbi:MAG: glucose-1-phosphate adenylyltransferase [Candidatus Omnitrophica bacterium]|nr:glucose-1-phosphate adenylyltransferase [Candidatus Omnitrophota bacterium]